MLTGRWVRGRNEGGFGRGGIDEVPGEGSRCEKGAEFVESGVIDAIGGD